MSNEKKVILAGQIGVVTPRTKPETVFHYNDSKDLENLVSFVGVKPAIDFEKGKIIPRFKKVVINEGVYVFRNILGEVRTMEEKEFSNHFEVQAVSEYKPNEHANKVQPKEVKTKEPKK